MPLFSPVEGWGIVLQCCSVWLVIMFGTELLWTCFEAKVSLSLISSSCSIQSLSVFCYFFFGKLTYFFIFSFPSWKEDSWVIVGWNMSFELDLLALGLLMVFLVCSDTIRLTMNEMALLILMFSGICVCFEFFIQLFCFPMASSYVAPLRNEEGILNTDGRILFPIIIINATVYCLVFWHL